MKVLFAAATIALTFAAGSLTVFAQAPVPPPGGPPPGPGRDFAPPPPPPNFGPGVPHRPPPPPAAAPIDPRMPAPPVAPPRHRHHDLGAFLHFTFER